MAAEGRVSRPATDPPGAPAQPAPSSRRLKLRWADPGTRFAAGFVPANLGQSIPINLGGIQVDGALVATEVVDDGAALEFTVEVHGDAACAQVDELTAPKTGPAGFSIGPLRAPRSQPNTDLMPRWSQQARLGLAAMTAADEESSNMPPADDVQVLGADRG